jgi:uncharacterized membrane protein YhaH (DUF805 family)
MLTSYAKGWKKSFDYSGRATRSDFWWFVLVDLIIYLIFFGVNLFILFNISDSPVTFIVPTLAGLYFWGGFLPRIALAVRRMRDIGKSWAWILLIPTCVLLPWFIYLAIQPSVVG